MPNPLTRLGRPRRERLHPALEEYLRALPETAAGSNPSLFWERVLEPFGERYDHAAELMPEEIDAIVCEGSYGFETLPAGAERLADDPEYALAVAKSEEFHRLRPLLGARRLEMSKQQYEHMRGLYFLGGEGLLKEYVKFLEPLGVRSNMTVARHWYHARQVAELVREHLGERPLDVLEIGAGAANLACFLTRMGLVRSYCIVDLPEMLVHSGYTVQRHLPEAELSFDDPSLGAARDGRPRFSFIPSQRAGELPGDAFDLSLNFNSFMEMDQAARDGYIELIYRAGRPGSIFFNVNRRQPDLPQRDGTTWDNNPLLYPYRPDDRVLLWEEDRFQAGARAKWGAIRSFPVTRAAVIRAGDAAA